MPRLLLNELQFHFLLLFSFDFQLSFLFLLFSLFDNIACPFYRNQFLISVTFDFICLHFHSTRSIKIEVEKTNYFSFSLNLVLLSIHFSALFRTDWNQWIEALATCAMTRLPTFFTKGIVCRTCFFCLYFNRTT